MSSQKQIERVLNKNAHRFFMSDEDMLNTSLVDQMSNRFG